MRSASSVYEEHGPFYLFFSAVYLIFFFRKLNRFIRKPYSPMVFFQTLITLLARSLEIFLNVCYKLESLEAFYTSFVYNSFFALMLFSLLYTYERYTRKLRFEHSLSCNINIGSSFMQDFRNLLNYFRERSQLFLAWIIWNLSVFVLFQLLKAPHMQLIIFTIVIGTILLSISYFVLAGFYLVVSGNESIKENAFISSQLHMAGFCLILNGFITILPVASRTLFRENLMLLQGAYYISELVMIQIAHKTANNREGTEILRQSSH